MLAHTAAAMFRRQARALINAAVLVAVALCARPVLAQQILQTYGDTLTSVLFSGHTGGQDVKPRFDQRGVNLDGSLRSPATFRWALAGNPFGEGTVPDARLGEVRLATG